PTRSTGGTPSSPGSTRCCRSPARCERGALHARHPCSSRRRPRAPRPDPSAPPVPAPSARRRRRSMTTADGLVTPPGKTAAPSPPLTPALSPARRRRRRSDNVRGWLYLAPFLLAFGLFLIWPTVYGLWMSFTGTSLAGTNTQFVGLANWKEALGDPQVWTSLGNTVWFTVLSTIPLVLVAMLLAVLVNIGLPGQWFWRLSFFMPFLLASTVVSQFWNWMYNPQLGLVNTILGWFGITG